MSLLQADKSTEINMREIENFMKVESQESYHHELPSIDILETFRDFKPDPSHRDVSYRDIQYRKPGRSWNHHIDGNSTQ